MTESRDFSLTVEELRAVTRYALGFAEELLPRFELARPGDCRPRAATDAAREFAGGAPRTKLQRVISLDAHRAARAAPSEIPRLAAQACGDAASAAYLHPIRKAHQVGHILRAAGNAARVAEIDAGELPGAADAAIERARAFAAPTLIDVLRRYPPAPAGRSRAARLMTEIDQALRGSPS